VVRGGTDGTDAWRNSRVHGVFAHRRTRSTLDTFSEGYEGDLAGDVNAVIMVEFDMVIIDYDDFRILRL